MPATVVNASKFVKVAMTGDICTTNDSYDASCNCLGTFEDSDNDSICDTNDLCPGFDDTIDTDNDNIPDACDDCLDDSIELNNPNIIINRQANISIQTNGILINGNSVEYHAGQQVDLLSGFEVRLGAEFHAFMEGCE